MEYNTTRNYLVIREYGRHIQKMVEHVLTLPDKAQRNEQALLIIELMGALNPHLKNVEDFKHILWDHLFFISDFKLDVDCPYEIPQRETYRAKPDPLSYPKRKPKYSHLGKNLELVLDKAMHEEDPEKVAGFAHSIAYYMKLSYSNWHKELVYDDQIRAELNNISEGKLEFSNTPYIKHKVLVERDDYGRGGNNRRQNFGSRNGNNQNNKRNKNNRNGNNNNLGNKKNNNNKNFKKRY